MLQQCVFLLLLSSPVVALCPANAVFEQQRTPIYNDNFIDSLLQTVTYEQVAATTYPHTSKPMGDGKLIRFTNGGNTYTCFKSKNNTFTASFVVTKPDPVLAPFLQIGMPKSQVLKKLGKTKSLDTIQVSNVEGMAVAILAFQQDVLAKVSFAATID